MIAGPDLSSRHSSNDPYEQTTLDTVPASIDASPATITTTGKHFVISDGSIPITAGAWIFDPTQPLPAGPQVRMVKNVRNATEGDLAEAFPTDLAAATLFYIPFDVLTSIWAVDIIFRGATGLGNNVPWKTGETWRIGLPIPAETDNRIPIKPVIVDASGGKDAVIIPNAIKTP